LSKSDTNGTPENNRKEMPLSRMPLIAAALVAGFGVALAQGDPVKERNDLMGALWREGLRPVARMARGEEPYNPEIVEKSYSRMSEIAARLPPLWPANSVPKNPTTRYSSSPKIWENKADFDALLAKMTSAIGETRKTAVSGPDGGKAAYQAVDQTCNTCHDRYQVRNR
jgi:cytochrome c556